MPVLEHEVHEKTIRKAGHLYGCHNKPRRREPLLVKAGFAGGRLRQTLIDDFGSLECRYDKSLTDQQCESCEHRGSGEEYAASVRERGR